MVYQRTSEDFFIFFSFHKILEKMYRITKSLKSSGSLTIILLFVLATGVVKCKAQFLIEKDPVSKITSHISQHNKTTDNHSIFNMHYEETEYYNRFDHKLLMPLDSWDISSFCLASLGLMVAAGGGIGGGGILVPIYSLILHFSPKYAIPLSNISVFGGAVANVILNLRKRHPIADRPLVDWDLILIMEPLTIGGALIGAAINKLLPELLIILLLVVVLSTTSYRMLKKGIDLYTKENIEKRKNQPPKLEMGGVYFQTESTENLLEDIDSHLDDIHTGLTLEIEQEMPMEDPVDKNNLEQNKSNFLIKDLKSQRDADCLRQILEKEKCVPFRKIWLIFLLFSVVVILDILKGGGGEQSPVGIVCNSVWFWVIQGVVLLWVFVIAYLIRECLLRRTKLKEEVNYPYIEGDIVWDSRTTLVYPLICSTAGLFAGMFGVGGGIVKGPLMLIMGIHPLVAAATSATMILFTSLTATISFITYGLLQYEYAIVLGTIGFVATLIGQTIMNILIKKSGRTSYIVLAIGIVVFLSAILMVIKSFSSINKNLQGLNDSKAHYSLCDSGS